jgi:hypothetical protein
MMLQHRVEVCRPACLSSYKLFCTAPCCSSLAVWWIDTRPGEEKIQRGRPGAQRGVRETGQMPQKLTSDKPSLFYSSCTYADAFSMRAMGVDKEKKRGEEKKEKEKFSKVFAASSRF